MYPKVFARYTRKWLSSAWSKVAHTSQQRARRRIPTARRRIAAQDFRIGTLDATRYHSVPFANLFRRVELEKLSFHTRKLFDEADCFLCDEAVPLERKSSEIERVQPAPRVPIKNRMLCVLSSSPELCYFSSFALAALVRSRIG